MGSILASELQSPHGVSIVAIYRGILFAVDAGLFPLLIETDFFEAVMIINSRETIWTNVDK